MVMMGKPLIKLDEAAIKDEIRSQVSEIMKSTDEMWLWDVETMIEKTAMGKTFLEEEFLSDPRMKLIEIKKVRKRWYPVMEAKRVMTEIMEEWE